MFHTHDGRLEAAGHRLRGGAKSPGEIGVLPGLFAQPSTGADTEIRRPIPGRSARTTALGKGC